MFDRYVQVRVCDFSSRHTKAKKMGGRFECRIVRTGRWFRAAADTTPDWPDWSVLRSLGAFLVAKLVESPAEDTGTFDSSREVSSSRPWDKGLTC